MRAGNHGERTALLDAAVLGLQHETEDPAQRLRKRRCRVLRRGRHLRPARPRRHATYAPARREPRATPTRRQAATRRARSACAGSEPSRPRRRRRATAHRASPRRSATSGTIASARIEREHAQRGEEGLRQRCAVEGSRCYRGRFGASRSAEECHAEQLYERRGSQAAGERQGPAVAPSSTTRATGSTSENPAIETLNRQPFGSETVERRQRDDRGTADEEERASTSGDPTDRPASRDRPCPASSRRRPRP